MERKIIEALNKIEVPQETSRAAEELLIREFLNDNNEGINNNENKIMGEKSMKVKLENKRNRFVKVAGATAAALVAFAGITAASIALKDSSQGNQTQVSADRTATPGPTIAEGEDSIIDALRERYPYVLQEGANYIDLDLDGTKEEIVLENIPSDTSMKGYKITLGNQTIEGEVDREEGLRLCAFMLTEDKKSVQLLFTDQYFSDDYKTQVYNYENGQLVKVGEFLADVDNLVIDEDGSMDITQQHGILGLMKDTTVSMVANDYSDISITGKYCLKEEDHIEADMNFEYNITALQDVKVYKTMDCNGGYAEGFKEGETGKTLKVIDGKWLYLENASGDAGYMEIDLEDFIIDGEKISGWQVFEGLPYAG